MSTVVPLTPDIIRRLEALGVTDDSERRELILRAIEEALQDLEDVRAAEEVLSNPGKTYSLGEMKERLGLVD